MAGLSYEVVPGNEGAASDFLQILLGKSDYAKALGANFSALVASTYALNPASKLSRAFWINPAVTWGAASAAGDARYSLSQVSLQLSPHVAVYIEGMECHLLVRKESCRLAKKRLTLDALAAGRPRGPDSLYLGWPAP